MLTKHEIRKSSVNISDRRKSIKSKIGSWRYKNVSSYTWGIVFLKLNQNEFTTTKKTMNLFFKLNILIK